MKSRMWAACAGVILLAAAIFIKNGEIESFFGRAAGSLAWGPLLARAVAAIEGLLLLAVAGWEPRQAGSRILRAPDRLPLGILTVLTLVALALRIPGLNSCMWLDEVLTMARFARPPAAVILTSFPDQNQHMLFSMLAHGSMRLFGESVWALRLPSVLFGLASLWALFLLGRRVAGQVPALAACALAAVSYHHVWFSQNARGYMGLMFFTTLSTWLWLEAMDRDRPRWWVAYAAALALGFWIHVTMLFVTAAHAVIFFVWWLRSGRDPGRLARAAAGFALAGLLTLQVYALALPEFLRSAVGEVSMPSEWTNPMWVVRETLRNLSIGFAAMTVVAAGGLLVLAGWAAILRRDARAAWAMVLPAVMGGVSMMLAGHNLWPRFFFFCMGFGLLIAAEGAFALPRAAAALFPSLKLRPAWGFAFAGLMIAASASTVPRCWALPKQDFTGARDFAEAQRGPGDAIVAVGLAGHAYGWYAPRWSVAATAEDLAAVRRSHPASYVVYTLPIELRAFHPALWRAVEENYEPVKVFYGSLGGGEVYVCREKPSTRERSLTLAAR